MNLGLIIFMLCVGNMNWNDLANRPTTSKCRFTPGREDFMLKTSIKETWNMLLKIMHS